jgi:hypothetical protein
MLVDRKTDIKHINLGTVLPQLTTASWQTASATGALGHMKYGVVTDFAKVYDLQEVYTRNRKGKLEQLALAMGVLGSHLPDERRQPADYQELRTRLATILGGLWAEEQLARDLGKMYGQLLQQYGGNRR